jgi:hypothetical protein
VDAARPGRDHVRVHNAVSSFGEFGKIALFDQSAALRLQRTRQQSD